VKRGRLGWGARGEEKAARNWWIVDGWQGVPEVVPECELIETPSLDAGCPKGIEEPRCRIQ